MFICCPWNLLLAVLFAGPAVEPVGLALIKTCLTGFRKVSCSFATPRERSLSALPISVRKAQSRKYVKKICLIIIHSCYFDYRIDKPFTASRCVICISCSPHLSSTYYVRKGAWAFIKSSLPTNQRGRRIRSNRGKGLAAFRGTVTTSSFMKLGRHVACGFAQFYNPPYS